MLSNSQMQAAAAQVRQIAASMEAVLADLGTPDGWSGRDADRFARDWHDQVTSRLRVAANKLDGVSFEELTEGFGG